jgi:acyl carrier protein
MTSSKSAVTLTEDKVATIREIVCEILDIEDDELTESGLFAEEHGADSMSLVAIMSGLESTFDIEIAESELSRMTTLEGVFAVVGEQVAAN